MRFLVPVGGVVDFRFGVLTSPYHVGVPAGIVAGMEWAADLGVIDGPKFIKRFQGKRAFSWLDSMLMWRPACLFIQCPDVYADARRTIDEYWRFLSHFSGWPLAFVAQDGQEDLEFPGDEFEALFVGGSTAWKVSDAAASVILEAQRMGKHIHIGRVNWGRRYFNMRGLPGSDGFTCDGTRTRWGKESALTAWAKYQSMPYSLRLPLYEGDFNENEQTQKEI